MKSYMLVLLTASITLLTVIIFIGAFYWYSLVFSFGPMTLCGLIMSLILFLLSFDKDNKGFRLASLFCVAICVMFIVAYAIMCFRTGWKFDFWDFLLYR